MYNSSGSSLSSNENQKSIKIKAPRSTMNPTFVSRMLQNLAESTSGFSAGRRSRRRREEPAFTVFEVPFEAGGGWGWWGEGSRALGQGSGVGAGGCFCCRLARGAEQRLPVPDLHLGSTKFSFRSPDRPRRERAPACSQAAGHGAGRGHAPAPRRSPACHGRTWKEKPAFTGLSPRVVSLLAEEAQITTWVLFLFFI